MAETNLIEQMSRPVFHQNLVRNIGGRDDFGKLVIFGAGSLTDDEKSNLRAALAANGVPYSMTGTDSELYRVAKQITARAVALR